MRWHSNKGAALPSATPGQDGQCQAPTRRPTLQLASIPLWPTHTRTAPLQAAAQHAALRKPFARRYRVAHHLFEPIEKRRRKTHDVRGLGVTFAIHRTVLGLFFRPDCQAVVGRHLWRRCAQLLTFVFNSGSAKRVSDAPGWAAAALNTSVAPAHSWSKASVTATVRRLLAGFAEYCTPSGASSLNEETLQRYPPARRHAKPTEDRAPAVKLSVRTMCPCLPRRSQLCASLKNVSTSRVTRNFFLRAMP